MKRALTRLLGRTRLRLVGGWFSLIVVSAGLAAAVVAAAPWLTSRMPSIPRLDAGGALIVLTWLLTLVASYLVWRRFEQRHRVGAMERVRMHLARYRRRVVEVSSAQHKDHEQQGAQVNALLQLNRGLRARLAATHAEFQSGRRQREALLNMVQEPVLVTDATGVVLGASPSAATLLRCPRDSLVGRRFADSVPLFQHEPEMFQQYPLTGFLDRVLQSASSIPQMQEARLLNHENEAISVIVTAAVTVDTADKVIGSVVRINRTDSEQVEAATHRGALSLADSQMQNWGTTLLSREPFERRLDELLAESRVNATQYFLLVLRVDDLDRINDEHGYWAGEQALWHAAKNVALAVVDFGSGYRYSNARFAVLLSGYDEARVLEIAERIRAQAAAQPMIWNGEQIRCTFSISVVPVSRDVADRTALLAAAETLLSAAKTQGGNRVLTENAAPATVERRRSDQVWLEWLMPRMRDGRAHLISQQMQPMAEGALPMVECFIRVEDDDGIWLEPGNFLPAVERLQQAPQVDLWTLRSLLNMLEANPALLESQAALSLNLAPSSLLDPQFGEELFEIVASSGVPMEKLCLEISESFAISQTSVLQRFMEMIRPTGVHFALDRCESTLGVTQLRHLPIDYMKIHPSVTANVAHDALDRTHLEWLCKAAHLLGRKTVAINIEKPEAVEWLRRCGVDYVQGSAINKIGPVMT